MFFTWPNPKEYEPICDNWEHPDPNHIAGINNIARMVIREEIDLQEASDLMRGLTADMSTGDILDTQLDLQTARSVYNEAHDIFVAERMRRMQTPIANWDVV